MQTELLLHRQQQPAEYAWATFVNKEGKSVPNTVPGSCIPYIKYTCIVNANVHIIHMHTDAHNNKLQHCLTLASNIS